MKAKLQNLKEWIVNNKKLAIGICAAVLIAIIVIIVLIIKFSGEKKTEPTGFGKGTYTVELKSEGGYIFSEAGVYIYSDSTLSELVDFKKTDENGKITFESSEAKGYVAVIKEIPEGYDLKEYYEITGKETSIVLKTVITELTDMDTTTFKLGSVIKDFTVTTADGTKVEMSALLAEKNAVVLNFFYLDCMPCRDEFPYLEEAYKEMSENVAVLAMTPVDKDEEAIKAFYDELGLTFYMAACDEKWQNMFNIEAYPMTVVIDRYGVVSFIHSGSITASEQFKAVFEFFASEDYKQMVVKNMEEIFTYVAEEGTEQNPIKIAPDAKQVEIEVLAGDKVYCQIPNVQNKIFTFSDENVYVEYNGETYTPVDGVLTMSISAPSTYEPAIFVIGNNGDADKTFTVLLNDVEGSIDNPYTMTLGDFSVSSEAGNDQGVYFMYTATEEGYLSVKCTSVTEGVNYDFTVYNFNTYASRSLSTDGEDGVVKVGVHKDDVVQVYVMTLPDDNNQYPAAEFEMNATHEVGEVEDITGSTEETTTTEDNTEDSTGNSTGDNTGDSTGNSTGNSTSNGTENGTGNGGSQEEETTTPVENIPVASEDAELYDFDMNGDMVDDEVVSYKVGLGKTNAKNMVAGDYTFFVYTPTESGIFKISTDKSAAKLSYWGGSVDYYYNITSDEFYNSSGNYLNIEVMDGSVPGAVIIFAVKGSAECCINIERTGDASKPIERVEYGTNVTVKDFTYTGSTAFTYFDIKATSAPTLVLGSDGYYHKGSATGPIVYVNMHYTKYHSFTDRFGITTNAGGAALVKYFDTYYEDYTALMKKYAENRDEATNMYPLTKEMKYILESSNEHYRWGEYESENYLFYNGTQKITGVNADIAWMFACCYAG